MKPSSLKTNHGASLVETVLAVKLVALALFGLVMLFGDNVRALFASADNSLVGMDSSPATRTAPPASASQKAKIHAALVNALSNSQPMGDWRRSVNYDPSRIRGMEDWQAVRVNAKEEMLTRYRQVLAADSPKVHAYEIGGAATAQAILGISQGLLRIPQTSNRFFHRFQQSVDAWGRLLGMPEWMMRPRYPNPLDTLEHGFDVFGHHAAGFTEAADAVADSLKTLHEEVAPFQAVGRLANRFNAAAISSLLQLDIRPIANELSENPSVALAALGSGLPSLLLALKSGGSRSMLALLESLEVSNSSAEFERTMRQETSDPHFRIPPQHFFKAQAQAVIFNTALERLGLSRVQRVLPAGKPTRDAVRHGVRQLPLVMLFEGLTEGLQTTNTDLAMDIMIDPIASSDRRLSQRLAESAQQAPFSVLAGAASAGTVGTVGVYYSMVKSSQPHPSIFRDEVIIADSIPAPTKAENVSAVKVVTTQEGDPNKPVVNIWEPVFPFIKQEGDQIRFDDTQHPDPGQLISEDGTPLGDFTQVMQFSRHGWTDSFESMNTADAAGLIADQVVAYNRSRPAKKQIRYLFLDACHQGTPGKVTKGPTNAQVLQAALDQELAERGIQHPDGTHPVIVLAAKDPGKLRAAFHRGEHGFYTGYPTGSRKTLFVPADQQTGWKDVGAIDHGMFLMGEGMFMLQEHYPFMRYIAWPVAVVQVLAINYGFYWVMSNLLGLMSH